MAQSVRSARNASQKNAQARRGGSTFVGFLAGLVTGLFIALIVAWYINKLPNPFREKPASGTKATAPAYPGKEPPKVAAPSPAPDKAATPTKDASAKETTEKSATDKKSTAAARETFFLQAGSFQNAAEADSLKSQLALLGLEAVVQTRNVADKGVWHRVRVGPYTDMDELNRVRGILQQNNIDSALVKVREGE